MINESIVGLIYLLSGVSLAGPAKRGIRKMSTEKVCIVYDERRQKGKPYLVRWRGESSEVKGPRRYCKGFRLKKDAERFAAEKQHEFNLGGKRDQPCHVTLERFSQDWLKARQKDLRQGTLDLYQNAFDQLIAYFGKSFLLEDVTPRHASLFIASVERIHPTKNDKPLSPWSKARILRNCKSIFQVAVDWELIRSNPFKGIRPPKLALQRWRYITVDEYKKLLKMAPTLYWKAFYAIAYTAGLRFGEAFNIVWSDIDFKKGEIHVCSKPGSPTLPPFSIKDFEERVVPIPKHTLDILSALREKAPKDVPYVLIDQKRYRRILANWQKCPLEGRVWRNRNQMNNLLRDFRVQAKHAGLRPDGLLTIHCLRKSCGQNWANALPIHVVMELMGHSDIATTQKFYNQVEKDQRRQAAKVIQELVGEEKKGKMDTMIEEKDAK
jgi:integrase